MMSGPPDVLNDIFVCYQDYSEYIDLSNIKQGKVVFLALKNDRLRLRNRC